MSDIDTRDAALSLARQLHSISSSMVDALKARLKSSLGAPGGARRSLDKSGADIQREALQVCLLMQGRVANEKMGAEALSALRAYDSDHEIASFLQYWASLSLMAGVCAPGQGDDVTTAYVDWYRGPPGQARHMPSLVALRGPGGLEAFVLQGWMPASPPIRRDRLVTALGSCFADEIRIWLRSRGYRVNDDFRAGSSYPHLEDSAVPLLQCSAGLVNTFVLLQQFQWALERKPFDDDLWVGAKGSIALPTEAARQKTADMFGQTSLFVITLGLAEVWFQRTKPRAERPAAPSPAPAGGGEGGGGKGGGGEGGGGEGGGGCCEPAAGLARGLAGVAVAEADCVESAMWRAVPSDRYDPARHGFRVTTVAENVANLREMVRLVRAHVPSASIVFTLSPVPLAATFRGSSCVVANSASKAILRAAVDEVLRDAEDAERRASRRGGGGGGGGGGAGAAAIDGGFDAGRAGGKGGGAAEAAAGGLYYWPAYEMVKEGFADPCACAGMRP